MKIIFTICSNNYLAQAKVLEKSVKIHNPAYIFFLCLVDEILPEIKYPKNTLKASEIGIKNFDSMILNYNIIELNTAVKPFFIKFLFEKFTDSEHVIYLDPDVKVYHNMKFIDENLTQCDVLLTPHALSPLPISDNLFPKENLFLNHGIYNLGFVCFKNSAKSVEILTWWCERLYNHCIIDLKEGFFVDQLWINLVPIYFEKHTKVLFNKGLNVAFWNLHERQISINEKGKYSIDSEPLVFFHFSGFNPFNSSNVAKNQDRINFIDRPDIIPLFEEYKDDLINNGYERYSTIKPYYTTLRNEYISNELQKKKSTLKGFLRIIISESAKKMRYYINKLDE